MTLSERMYALEVARNSLRVALTAATAASKLTTKKSFRGSTERKARRLLRQPIPEVSTRLRETIAEAIAAMPEERVDDTFRAILATDQDVTASELLRLGRATVEAFARQQTELHAQMRASEREVRDISQAIAAATGQGE